MFLNRKLCQIPGAYFRALVVRELFSKQLQKKFALHELVSLLTDNPLHHFAKTSEIVILLVRYANDPGVEYFSAN